MTELFTPKKSQPLDGEIHVHFIDVGQGDSILIEAPEGNMLIDAGTNSSESALKAYLDKENITTITYAVFTHMHEDHIGGADMVLENYEVKNVIIPDQTSTTGDFTRMMDWIEKNGSEVIKAVTGSKYSVGEMSFTVLGPSGKITPTQTITTL